MNGWFGGGGGITLVVAFSVETNAARRGGGGGRIGGGGGGIQCFDCPPPLLLPTIPRCQGNDQTYSIKPQLHTNIVTIVMNQQPLRF